MKNLILLVLLTSCLSSHQNSTLDGIESKLSPGTSKSTFVEAYVEYTGPSRKWAGAPTFILHVQAKDVAQDAKIWVSPPVQTDEAPTRAPASVLDIKKEDQLIQTDGSKKISAQNARERIAELATLVQSSPLTQQFKGCLYPVRIWLIKADGGIVEDRGCRGQSGWVAKASLLVSDALASLH